MPGLVIQIADPEIQPKTLHQVRKLHAAHPPVGNACAAQDGAQDLARDGAGAVAVAAVVDGQPDRAGKIIRETVWESMGACQTCS